MLRVMRYRIWPEGNVVKGRPLPPYTVRDTEDGEVVDGPMTKQEAFARAMDLNEAEKASENNGLDELRKMLRSF